MTKFYCHGCLNDMGGVVKNIITGRGICDECRREAKIYPDMHITWRERKPLQSEIERAEKVRVGLPPVDFAKDMLGKFAEWVKANPPDLPTPFRKSITDMPNQVYWSKPSDITEWKPEPSSGSVGDAHKND